MPVAKLPMGSAPKPVSFPHFPSRLHAFVWRNWQLVTPERMAAVTGGRREDIVELGRAMGLGSPPRITPDQQRRSYITVIKRNWHLLPYEQLLQLLGWTAEQLAYALREDDFLFVKLGQLKPACEPLRWTEPDEAMRRREREMAAIVREEFGESVSESEPLFSFVARLSDKFTAGQRKPASRTKLRFCYSYFALYGDPLLEPELQPYPDGYLARLADAGVTGVWLQAVLYKLARFPWQPELSAPFEERLRELRRLAARARRYGIKVFLYLNEPRAMPVEFFAGRAELKGVVEGGHATLCTSDPRVQDYLRNSVESICRAAPELGGFFTITASENLTNCWSHGQGAGCPRCKSRAAAEVIAEVNSLIQGGISRAGNGQRLIAWDWGWNDAWAEDVIARLPQGVSLMSVSEWSLPIERGGVKTEVGEYCLSAVGPGPRAKRHWTAARRRGLPVLAKIQAGNTWELSATPYIPAVANVARHAANLRAAGVEEIMLGWTLGGYPSPNLEAVAEVMQQKELAAPEAAATAALNAVAQRRFGKKFAPAVVQAWKELSEAFSEFPFHTEVVYGAPLQNGPSNLLWAEPTGYQRTMVGFPYDHLDGWRGPYPPEVFIAQLEKVANGFDAALKNLILQITSDKEATPELSQEISMAIAAAIHWRSVACQARFVLARGKLAKASSAAEAQAHLAEIETVLKTELKLARHLYTLQSHDSRLGFEASNQYYYVPLDLVEKVLNCRDLLDRWLPAQRQRIAGKVNRFLSTA